MKSLQWRTRANLLNFTYLTRGSSVVRMGAPTDIKVPHSCRIKSGPGSHGKQYHQIRAFKTASKKLHPRSPSLSTQAAFSYTSPENGAEEAEVARPELNADFPDEAIPTSSGYLPISAESKSKLFYVFYEATDNVRKLTDTPIVLWLNGGPGCSSLIGCFYELGPWKVNEKLKLTSNEGAGCSLSTNPSARASASRRSWRRFRLTSTPWRRICFTHCRAGCCRIRSSGDAPSSWPGRATLESMPQRWRITCCLTTPPSWKSLRSSQAWPLAMVSRILAFRLHNQPTLRFTWAWLTRRRVL